jgi:hypothetical protein
LGEVRLGDLPDDDTTAALLRRRCALGLPTAPSDLVMVNHEGRGYSPGDVPIALRRARSTRISIDGNAHFCRGLLRTRYPGSEQDQTDRPEGAEPADALHRPPSPTTFIPRSQLKEHLS